MFINNFYLDFNSKIGKQYLMKLTQNSQSFSNMNLNPFQKNSKEILKGQKLEIEKMLKFEEINEKSFKGKLKKFQMETHRSNAFRKPDFNNNSIMDYCLFKTDLSLEKKRKLQRRN